MESEEKNEPQKDKQERRYSEKIASAVKAQLDQSNVYYEFDKEEGAFAFVMKTPEDLPYLKFIVHIDDDGFTIFLFMPDDFLSVSEERIPAMAEFVTRLNHSLRYGRFEIDFSDGETRFFLRVDCGESVPTEQRVYWAVLTAGFTTLQHARAFVSVAKGETSPCEAVKATEFSLDELFMTLNNRNFQMFASSDDDDNDDSGDDGDDGGDGGDDGDGSDD